MSTYRLIRLPEVMTKTGLKRSQVYRDMKSGDFPQSCKIGPVSVAWLESEIDEWITMKLNYRESRSN